jgi:hypothetical protein
MDDELGGRQPGPVAWLVLLAGVLVAIIGVGSPASAAGAGSINVSIYNDDLGDGVRGPGDQLGGFCSAQLDPAANGESAAQTIQREDVADGTFTFAAVPPGPHTVAVSCLYSTQDRPPSGIQEQLATTPNPLHLTVSPDTITEASFGTFVPPFVFGQVFSDDNADGVKQASEPGLDGCTVTLDGGTPATTATMVPYHFHATDHGAFQQDPGPGRHHLAATCPGRSRLTTAPADFVAHSRVQLGTAPQTFANGNAPAPLYFGFAPATATTGRTTTTTAAPTASSIVSSTTTSSTSTSSTTVGSATTRVRRTSSTEDGGSHAVAYAVGIAALVGALGALGFAYRRRAGG